MELALGGIAAVGAGFVRHYYNTHICNWIYFTFLSFFSFQTHWKVRYLYVGLSIDTPIY